MYFEILGEIQWRKPLRRGAPFATAKAEPYLWKGNLEETEGNCQNKTAGWGDKDRRIALVRGTRER